jgi:hypothetical protein
MAYRLRYVAYIDYLPEGTGVGNQSPSFNASSQGNPITATTGPVAGASVGPSPAGAAQSLAFVNAVGGQATKATGAANPGGNSLAAGDITTLVTAMTTDLSAQMNAQLARLAQFPAGGT